MQEVEEGLPRKEAIRIYGLRPSTIGAWMRTYCSTHYQQHFKRNSNSNLQKRTIVSAVEQGRMSVRKAQIAYKVKAAKTIRDCVYFAATSPNGDVAFWFAKIYIRNVRQWSTLLRRKINNGLKFRLFAQLKNLNLRLQAELYLMAKGEQGFLLV